MSNMEGIFNNILGGFKWESPMSSKYIIPLYEKISEYIHAKYRITIDYSLDSVNGNLMCRFFFSDKNLRGDMITYIRVNDDSYHFYSIDGIKSTDYQTEVDAFESIIEHVKSDQFHFVMSMVREINERGDSFSGFHYKK